MKNLSVFSVALFATLVLMGVSCKKKDSTPSGGTDSTTYKGVSNLPKRGIAYTKLTEYDSATGSIVKGYYYDTSSTTLSYDAQGRLTTYTASSSSSKNDANNKIINKGSNGTTQTFYYTGNAVWPDSLLYTSNSGNTSKYIFGYDSKLGLPKTITQKYSNNNSYTSTLNYSQGATATNFYLYKSNGDTVTVSGNNLVKSGSSYGSSFSRYTTNTYSNYFSPTYNIKALGLTGGGFNFDSYNLLSSFTTNQTYSRILTTTVCNYAYSFDGNGRVISESANTESKWGAASLPSAMIISSKSTITGTISY